MEIGVSCTLVERRVAVTTMSVISLLLDEPAGGTALDAVCPIASDADRRTTPPTPAESKVYVKLPLVELAIAFRLFNL